jgi:hypothetical protein
MSVHAQKMLELLPAILRIRDQSMAVVTPGWLDPSDRVSLTDLKASVAAFPAPQTAADAQQLAQLQQQLDRLQQRAMAGPLASLIAVIAEQVAVLQEDLDQLYDDQFIETCAPWLTSYIGDLIGYRALNGISPKIASPRADVAHTIAYRRSKGTPGMLENLAHDVTGWNASAVEYFQHLTMTQYMNHRRLQCLAAPDLRDWERLERIGTAFDTVTHTVDVRRIASGRGRYNIHNIGVFLWRLNAYPLTGSPAVPLDPLRWRINPLGIDAPLYTLPQTADEIAALATPLNVPEPISRRVLHAHRDDYYTAPGAAAVTRSLRIYTSDNAHPNPQPVAPSDIRICNLADYQSGWAHQPAAGRYAIDPVLGRIALPPGLPAGTKVYADFHYGFSADIGGGEYERAVAPEAAGASRRLLRVGPGYLDPNHADPNYFSTIQAALNALGGDGIVEIIDSGRYQETLSINVAAHGVVELRAADKHRPTLVLGGDLVLGGAPPATGDADCQIRLNGLLITGGSLRASIGAANRLRKLQISHCTLVPGLALAPDCTPLSPATASLIAEVVTPHTPMDLEITIDHCIVGGLRADADASVSVSDSVIDATATTRVAYAAPDGIGPGAPLSLDACTVIGKLHALKLPMVTNSILLADLAPADPWTAPVFAARRQEGCVRFSYLPSSARVPRRYQCLPEAAASPALAAPRFTTLRYGFAAYAQLSTGAGAKLLTGADDEGQPGAFHSLYQPQREANLRVRLDEYLRVGLEAGIFYES